MDGIVSGIVIVIIFVLGIFIVLGYTIPIQKKHNKATGKVINHDWMMRKFVYKVCMSKDEIIKTLSVKNSGDELFCTFNCERSIVRFHEFNATYDYFFEIKEYDTFSVLRLNEVSFHGSHGHIHLKLNPFFVSKLNAEIVPFSKYGIDDSQNY